jgi:NDP-sugar pyrophosphorylase family protein
MGNPPPPRHAIVLTAGLGTRLRPLTDVRAKPAIPVAGEPMVRRIIAWLAANGVADLVLNLHHRPDTLTAVVGDGSDLAVRVRYSWEQPVVLGSAGGPRQALPIVGAETFLLVNGDTLTDLDLRPLADAHTASGALVTLALVPNREPRRYGGVRLDHRNRVTGFVARGPAAEGSHHFIGVQLVHADAFRSLAGGVAVNSIGGTYDALIATRPGSIGGYVCDARFWDVGTVLDYWNTSFAFTGHDPDDAMARGRRADVDASARVTRCIFWDDVSVGPACTLDECIVTDGVRVPTGASYRRVVLVRGDDDGVRVSPLTG